MSPVSIATAKAKPRDYKFPLPSTALVVQKMQREFLDEGGFGSLLGNDVSILKPIIPAVAELIEAARAAGVEVLHVKEGHKPDLSDAPPSKMKRTLDQSEKRITIGDEGPLGRILVLGEPGNEIVPECAPLPDEQVFASPAKGLYNTDLHKYCVDKEISHIILAGLTTEVGIQLVMRELNDRGFEPCLVEDCTGSYTPAFRDISFEMIVAQGGIIGWVTGLKEIKEALANPDMEELPPIPDWIPPTVPKLLQPDPHYPPPQSPPEEGITWATMPNAKPTPYKFPVEKTALIMIDMQRDFVLEGGFGSTLGNNVKLLQSIVPNVAFILKTCRDYKLEVVHTLEAHLPDLSDCPVAKLTRGGLPHGLRIGDKGDMGRILVRKEWGNDILDENAPLPTEKALFKPGKGAFVGTDLHPYLLEKGITHLLFGGVTTEVCVQNSMREASDRGFECLIVEDCTESYFPQFKAATLKILTAQGAIVGRSGTSQDFKEALVEVLGSKE